jgi:hypothetical protein
LPPSGSGFTGQTLSDPICFSAASMYGSSGLQAVGSDGKECAAELRSRHDPLLFSRIALLIAPSAFD